MLRPLSWARSWQVPSRSNPRLFQSTFPALNNLVVVTVLCTIDPSTVLDIWDRKGNKHSPLSSSYSEVNKGNLYFIKCNQFWKVPGWKSTQRGVRAQRRKWAVSCFALVLSVAIADPDPSEPHLFHPKPSNPPPHGCPSIHTKLFNPWYALLHFDHSQTEMLTPIIQKPARCMGDYGFWKVALLGLWWQVWAQTLVTATWALWLAAAWPPALVSTLGERRRWTVQ